MEKLKTFGKLSREDFEKLQKIDPEYAKNLKVILEKKDLQQKALNIIQMKIAENNLQPEDINALEKVNPAAAEKLKAVLKEQLKSKVSEVEKKLKTVKGAIDDGFNNTGFSSLRKQMEALGGTLKPYNQKELEKLQAKILAKKAGTVSAFDEMFERLSLDYDIKNLTGNSEDLRKILKYFFEILPKFNIPLIFQRSAEGILNGLVDIQEWFEMTIKVYKQAISKCGKTCKDSISYLVNVTKASFHKFDIGFCKTKWAVSVNVTDVTEICRILMKVRVYMHSYEFQEGNSADTVEQNIVQPISDVVTKWKGIRKEMESFYKQQWKNNIKTITILNNYKAILSKLKTTFYKASGKEELHGLPESKVIEMAEVYLSGQNSTVTLARYEVLQISFINIVSAIEKLPAAMERNKVSQLAIDTSQANQLTSSFNVITNDFTNSLTLLCEDKTPTNHVDYRILLNLIQSTKEQYQNLLRKSKVMSDLYLYSKRFSERAKMLSKEANEIKAWLLPCKLKKENIENNSDKLSEKAFHELKSFMSRVKPLARKSVEDHANSLKDIISKFEDGVNSPIGKLVSTMKKFIDQSPDFNIPLMFTETPKIGVLVVNSMKEYFTTAKQFFVAIQEILKQCGKGCKLEEVFGKSNLKKISEKLDKKLKPISAKARKFIDVIDFTPRGLPLLMTSIEEIRTSLQKIYISGTGFIGNGTRNIVEGFEEVESSLGDICNSLGTIYQQFTSPFDSNIKILEKSLSRIKESMNFIYKKSNRKFKNIQEVSVKISQFEEKLNNKAKDLKLKENIMKRRYDIVKEGAIIISDTAGQFHDMYSSNISNELENFIDTDYALKVTTDIENIRKSSKNILEKTNKIVDAVGVNLPKSNDVDIFEVDLAKNIHDMVNSVATRKIWVAKKLKLVSNELKKKALEFVQMTKTYIDSVVGKVNNYLDETSERINQKLERYGQIYDEIEYTIKEIKNKPISQTGKIKDAADELITSLGEYDLAMILSAHPKQLPKKTEEMKALFTNFGEAMSQIGKILRNCSQCNAVNIFGYNYLRSLTAKLNSFGNTMFTNIESYADTIGDSIGELQGVRKATGNIKDRFNKIAEGKKYDPNTFMEISNALFDSTYDIKNIRNSTENIVKILFDRDVDLEVISSTVNKIASYLGKVMNKSDQVALRGQKVYTKAKNIEKKLFAMKKNFSRIEQGPLKSRIEIAWQLSASTKSLLKEFPKILELSKDTLEEAGIDVKWLSTVGESINGLTKTISSVISKTNRVMNAAGMVVDGYQDIRNKYTDNLEKFNFLKDASWDKKVILWKELSATFGGVLDSAIEMSLKTAKVLNVSLTKNNLKSLAESVVGKERLIRYQNLSKNISVIMDKLQQGPIPKVGKLIDRVEDFVHGLDGYDFGKLLLKNPSDIKEKFSEFKELAATSANILKNIDNITGACSNCDAIDVFGEGFVKELAIKIGAKFETISKNISNVLSRVETGINGWEVMVNTAKGISANFHGLTDGKITKEKFSKISDALLKSAENMTMFINGSSKIFEAVFNGNKDIEYLQGGFDNLVKKANIVFNKSSAVLPKVGDIFESLNDVNGIVNNIKGNIKSVAEGSIESRINILKQITKGIKGIGKSLPVIFNQSQEVLISLNIDSKWFESVTKDLINVSQSISKILNKTNTVLDGAGIFVKDAIKVKRFADDIGKNLKEIAKAPLNQKFKIFLKSLGKVDNILNETNQIAGTIDQTLLELTGADYNITSNLGTITVSMSGFLGNLSNAVKKVASIHEQVLATLDNIKSGPIQNIGKLVDATKDFVGSIRNYNLAEILVQAPKFGKEKLGDFKQIIFESGGILKNISALVSKHCTRCNLDNIFGSGFVNDISGSITESLINITGKLENVLDKVEDNAGHIMGLVVSVKGIKKQIGRLQSVDFSQDGFKTISDVLLHSSSYLEEIRNGSGTLTKALFGENQDLTKLIGNYEGFLKKISGHLETAGNFSKDVSDTFAQFKDLKDKFDQAKSNFEDLTQGPLENRVNAVKNIVTGVDSVITGLPEVLKTSKISPSWLRSFGTQLEGITNGVSNILKKTSLIAGSVGQTIGNTNNIKRTADIIRNDFKRLGGSVSIGEKVRIATNIVGKVKTLTTQVNVIANDVNHIFGNLTGETLTKTEIFGNRTENILGKLSNGLGAIADRYEQFRELSKTISDAFKNIEDDPLNFALNDLPKLFNQTSKFTEVLFDDVKEVASKLGMEIDGLDILNKDIVDSAQTFFVFAQTTMNTIGSGAMFVKDFKNLLNSKSFKDSITSLHKLQSSGIHFIQNVDKLGAKLFENWEKMKGQFSGVVDDISRSLAINLKEMGTNLQTGLSIAGDALTIYNNIKNLLNLKEFNVKTVIQAANSVIKVANAAVSIAEKLGFEVGGDYLQTAGTYMNYVMAAYQLYEGIKAFKAWVNDACDLTYEDVVTRRNISYSCFKQEIAIEKVLVPVAVCDRINKEVLKGYGEAKLCCSKKECVFMQQVACLKQNEQCSNSKLELLKKLKISNLKLIPIYEEYLKFSKTVLIKEKEVKIREEILKAETYKLKRHEASMFQTKILLERAINASKDLQKQFKTVESLYQGGKSKLKVNRIDFKFVTTDPNSKNVPFKISVIDTNGQVNKINTVFSFEKDVISLKTVAHIILSSFFEYIPHMKHKRNIRSITDTKKKVDDLKHWTSLCIIYKEIFETIYNALKILRAEMEQATDLAKQFRNINFQAASSGQMKLREIINEASLETTSIIIKRWEQTTATILTGNIGSVCYGFRDCIEAQIENLTSIYKPELKGYDLVISYLTMLGPQLVDLVEYANTRDKKTNIHTVSNVFQLLEKIDVQTYFCDDLPRLLEKMPIKAFAYLKEVFELNCTVDGPASMDYVWRKNDTILPDQTSWKLRIDEVSIEDRGYYSCQGKISTLSAVSNRVLVLVYSKPSFKVQPRDQIFDYPGGQRSTWVCNGTAEPNCFYKWFFKPYQSSKPTLVGESSLFTISFVSQRHVGHYWCELSNGITTISSRKAKLDVVRVLPRKQSARISLKLSIKKNKAACLLPSTRESNDLLNAVKQTLNSKLGILETEVVINLSYYKDIKKSHSANISLGVSLKQSQNVKTNSINLALKVSNERVKLQEKLSNLLDRLDNENGASVYYNKCDIQLELLTMTIDWRADDLACPRGMGASEDNLKCGK